MSREADSAAPELDRPSRRRLTGAQRVWTLNLVLAGGAALLYVLVVHDLPTVDAPFRIPWWALAALFAVAEVFVIHVQFRREAHSFSLGEIPTLVGLFFVGPRGLVVAQLVGAATALILHRRQSPLKLAFNLGNFTLGACVAAIVFTALVSPTDPLGPTGWVAAFAAMAATDLLGAVLVGSAISLAEGSRLHLMITPRVLLIGMLFTVTNTSVGLAAVAVLWLEPRAAWLLAIPAAILVPAYRAYTSSRQRHETLESLYESTRILQGSLRVEPIVETLLAQARKMLRAEVAEIALVAPTAAHRAERTRLGPAERYRREEVDADEGRWLRAGSGRAVLIPRPIVDEELREQLESRGLRDAIVAPLLGKAEVMGTMLVGNRLGDVSTFDGEDVRVLEALANHAAVSLENGRLIERLEDSLERLTEMNRVKDDFVATVSHELRTPLTSIHGCIKTLLETGLNLDPSTRQSLLEVIDRQSDRLLMLIEDLLVASRIDSRAVRPQVAPTTLTGLVDQLVGDLAARTRGHLVQCEIPKSPVTVDTDEPKVRQILANLMENAFKYSPEGSTVTVRLVPGADGVTISVEDEGEGIPEHLRERIFERFYQVDQTTTRTVGGTGLGLYICRRLGEVIGGRITLERSGKDGSVFSLWLPWQPPGLPAGEEATRAEVSAG